MNKLELSYFLLKVYDINIIITLTLSTIYIQINILYNDIILELNQPSS